MPAERDRHGFLTSPSNGHRPDASLLRRVHRLVEYARVLPSTEFIVQLGTAFLAYYLAGKLGQAATAIRSSNIGPVWPASGIAIAVLLTWGYRMAPALGLGAFVVAVQSPVPVFTAVGQATGATLAAVTGTFALRRFAEFDSTLSRLRDVIALIVVGAFGSSVLSASIGIAALWASGLQSYGGLATAWVIYWLGDATGVLLVAPLVFSLPQLFLARWRSHRAHLLILLSILTIACLVVFGGWPRFPVQLDALALAVLPFVMWAAIEFGTGGASLAMFLIATIATLLTAVGSGPFAEHTPFVNAVMLDVLFTVLAATGLSLAAVTAERERAEAEHEQVVRTQATMETKLRLAAIVESSNDAVLSMSLDGVILSWNAAAQRMFEFTEAEAVGQPITIIVPSELQDESRQLLRRLTAGQRIAPRETIRIAKSGKRLHVAVTISPLRDSERMLVGVAKILRDITEQKLAEEALSSVSRRLIEAQEQERRRIARELHDDIGQRIALVAMNLDGLAKATVSSPRVHTQALDLDRQVGDIAADVSALSHRLHSPRLELLGMTAAMRQFCAEFAAQQKIAVDFEARDVPQRVSADISLCLFRILQEAAHNAAKHSHARRLTVKLSWQDDQIQLVVSDRGSGFDVERAKRGRGIGLISMEERIKLVNGELSIDSHPRRGTTIHARVRLGSAAGVVG